MKNKNNKVIKLYKIGKFYNAYFDDAIIIHKLVGYKYIAYKKSAGFPENALGKVKTILEDNKISYQIYEKDKITLSYVGIKKKYDEILKLGLIDLEYEDRINRLHENIDKLSIEEVQKVIEYLENATSK